MKKIILAIIIACAAMTASASAAELNVSVDGEKMDFANPPQMIGNSVMAPARTLLERFGAKVTYDAEKKAAIAVKDARYVELRAGNDYMYHGICKGGTDDGERVYTTSTKLDSAPVILNGAMLVPVRAVSEAFYYDVNWNGETGTVEMTAPDEADGWIYYASWSDDAHMYKVDTNGQHRQMLTDDDCCMSGYNPHFSYMKDYIYFNKRNENIIMGEDDILYRIKTDGTGEEQVSDAPARIIDTSAEDTENLYYVERPADSKYYRGEAYLKVLNAETGEKTQIIDELVSDVQIYKDYIYFRYANRESLKTAYSYFRMNSDGSDIINVTGDIPINYDFRIDKENEKLSFSSYGYKYYTADLDGSNIEEAQREENTSKFDEFDETGYSGRGNDSYVILGRKDDDEYTHIMDEDGNELFKALIPKEIDLYEIKIKDNAAFYSVQEGSWQEKAPFYAQTIDELAGMYRISVSKDKVDGKYEITDNGYYETYIPGENDGIYTVGEGDNKPRKIIDKYYLYGIFDGKLILVDISEEYSDDRMLYSANMDGSGIEEFMTNDEYYEMLYHDYNISSKVKLYENAKFGIIVYNDGTTEEYDGERY